jgi:hypothetical protein
MAKEDTNTGGATVSFDKLLVEIGEVEALHKAMGDDADGEGDDTKIKDAAEDGNADADDDGKNDVTGDDDDGEAPMGKSFQVTLADGTKVDAYDGEELMKSLIERVGANEGQMLKALGGAIKLIKSQGELIKSLQNKVQEFGSAGKGRKAVLTIHDKKPAGDLAKSHGDEDGNALTANDFMAKAHAAFDAGKISGKELASADTSLRNKWPVDAGVVQKVLQHSPS